jgi:Spy/CpxP family protein refolding chaperone
MKSAVPLLILFLVITIATTIYINKQLMLKNKPIRGYLDLIELTPEQKQKAEEIRKDFLPKVEKIRQELRQKRLHLNNFIFAQRPDMQAIEDTSREISDLQMKLEREVIDHILQEKEILTPEQQRDFYEIIKKEFEKGGLGVHGERR